MHDLRNFRAFCQHRRVAVYDGFYMQPAFGVLETLEALRTFFGAVSVDCHIVYYSGAARRRAGDWRACDGFIQLSDIIAAWVYYLIVPPLAYKVFVLIVCCAQNAVGGKRLLLVCDCSHAGEWARKLAAMEGKQPRGVVSVQAACGCVAFFVVLSQSP